MELSDTIIRGARASGEFLKEAAQVLVFFTGLALVCYGIWLVYEPAAFVFAGLAMAGLVALYVRGNAVYTRGR